MSFLTKLAIGIAFIALAVYLFGIPPQLKRKMERAALETMGENKASYIVKGMQFPDQDATLLEQSPGTYANITTLDQIGKIPTSDQRDVKKLKREVGQATDSLTKNPVGKEAGETLDGLTSSFTGR